MYCMFTTGNSTLLPGMEAQPQPGRYEGASVSPSAATTLTHASLHSSQYRTRNRYGPHKAERSLGTGNKRA